MPHPAAVAPLPTGLCVEHDDLEPVAGQGPGAGGPDDPRPDDRDLPRLAHPRIPIRNGSPSWRISVASALT